MACTYFYREQIFNSYEELSSYMKNQGLTLDENREIDRVFVLDSRLLINKKKEYGSNAVYSKATAFFARYMNKYMYTDEDAALDEKGNVVNIRYTRPEAVRFTQANVIRRQKTLQKRLDNKTLTDDMVDEYTALTALIKPENWKDMVKTFYPNFKIETNGDVLRYVEQNKHTNNEINSSDITELSNDEEDTFEIGNELLTGLQQFTEEQDTVNPLRKASEAVKDLMSSITIDSSDGGVEPLKPGFVFYKLLQNISGIDITDAEGDTVEAEILRIRKNFEENGMPKNADMSNRSFAIFSKIKSLLEDSRLTEDSEGSSLPIEDYGFVWTGDNQKGHYIFEDRKNKVLYDLKGLATPDLIKKVSNSTGLSIDVVNRLYNRVQAGETINSIYSVSNSMRSKFPIMGVFSVDWKKSEIDGKNNQIVELAYKPHKEIGHTTISKTEVLDSIWENRAALIKIPRSRYNSSQGILALLYELKLIPSTSGITMTRDKENVLIDAITKLQENLLLEGTPKKADGVILTDDNGDPIFYDKADFYKSNNNYANKIASITHKQRDDLGRSSSYGGADNKTRWFHTLSTQAHDKLFAVIRGEFLPAYMKEPMFTYNPFLRKEGLAQNVVYEMFDHEYTADESEEAFGKPKSYRQEKGKEWYERNFLYAFGNTVGNRKGDILTYIQQFYTVSNKPQIPAARINLLKKDAIRESMKQALLQEINRPDWKNVKGYGRDKTFLDGKYDLSKLRGMNSSQQNAEIEKVLDQLEKKWEDNSRKAFKEFLGYNPVFNKEFRDTYAALKKGGYIETPEGFNLYELSVAYVNQKSKFENEDEMVEKHLYPVFNLWYQNYMINSIFLNQLVAGQQAQFVDAYDQIKRMSIVFSQGYGGRVNEQSGLRKTFRVVALNDSTAMITDPQSRLFKNFSRLRGKDYKFTDGAGYLTKERADNIRKGFSREANVGSIMKGVYYGLDKLGIGRALKYASVEITNEMAQKFRNMYNLRFSMTFGEYIQVHKDDANEIARLYDLEVNNKLRSNSEDYFKYQEYVNAAYAENLAIDEAVYISGIKVGSPTKGSNVNEDGSITIDKESILELNNSNYRHQLNPRHDADSKTANPGQLTYQINTNGKNFASSKKVLDLNNMMMISGFEGKLEELDIQDDGNIKTNDWNNVRRNVVKMVRNILEKVAGNEQIVEFLDAGISMQMPFMVNKIQQSLLAAFSKSSIELKHAGSKLVLQSAIGTAANTLNEEGYREPKIVFTDKDGNPIAEDDSDTEAHSYYMEAYAPASMYKSLLDKGYTKEQILSDPVFNTLMGFRIPSTELHSAVPIKIIGWYPNKYGDNIVIMPKELVLLHGSDFDIDALYTIKPFVAEESVTDTEGRYLVEKGVAIGYQRVNGKTVPLKWLKGKSLTQHIYDEIEKTKVSGDLDKRAELRELLAKSASNEILKTFLNTITDYKNMQDMMTPIDMGVFNDVYDKNSVFSYFAELEGKRLGLTPPTDPDALAKWRISMLRKARNLNKADDNLLMHQDNFRSALLTGAFANLNKVVAYLFAATNDYTKTDIAEEDQVAPILEEKYHLTINGFNYDSFSRNVRDSKGLQDGKEGRPRNTIWQTIDALINGAIDHVKEQILNIINASEETGNVIVAMTAMGIPADVMSLYMVQPVLKELVNRGKEKNLNNNLKREMKYKIFDWLYANDAEYKTSLETSTMGITDEKEKEAKVKEFKDKYWAKFQKANKEVTITSEAMENTYGMNFSDVTNKEDLVMQYIILQKFEKLKEVGELLFKGSLFLGSLKQLPADFVGLQNIQENGDLFFDIQNFLKGEKYENPDKFPFTNVNLTQVPNIQAATKVVATLQDIIGELIIKNKKETVAFSEQVNDALHDNKVGGEQEPTEAADEEKTDTGKKKKGFLDFMYNKSTQLIRDNLIVYFLSGMNFDIKDNPLIEHFSMNISKEKPYVHQIVNKSGEVKGTKTFFGNDAWAFKMIEAGYTTTLKDGRKVRMKSLRKIREENKTNFFLRNLDIKVKQGVPYLSVPIGTDLDPIEKADYEIDFEALRNVPIYVNDKGEDVHVDSLHEGQYSELQYNILKYAVISQGLSFGSYKYSALMGSGIYKQVSQWLDDMMFGSFGYEDESKNKYNIQNIKEHFTLQLAIQNYRRNYNLNRKNSVRTSLIMDGSKPKSGKETILDPDTNQNTTVFYDAVVKVSDVGEKDKFDMPVIGKIGSSVYIKVATDGDMVYYQKTGQASQNSNFTFSTPMLKEGYTVPDYFIANRLHLSAGEIEQDHLIVDSKYEPKVGIVEVGMRIFASHPSDATRYNMKEYKVTKVIPVEETITTTNSEGETVTKESTKVRLEVELLSDVFSTVRDKNPDMTREEWEAFSTEEQQRYLDCIS